MVLLSHPHALPDTADEHRGTRACRHAQRHGQKPSATGSQVGTTPPSLTSFQDRQTESNTRHRHCHWYLHRCSGDTHAPTWTCLRNTHTTARHELPTAAGWANLSAGCRDASSSVSTAMSVALVANKDSAAANLWSDTVRGKGEGKRTQWTREVSVLLSDWEEGGYVSSFSQGLTLFFNHFGHCSTEHKSNLISPFDTAQQIVMSNFLCLEEGTAGCKSASQHSTPGCVCWCGKEGNASLCVGLLLGWYIPNLLAFIQLL